MHAAINNYEASLKPFKQETVEEEVAKETSSTSPTTTTTTTTAETNNKNAIELFKKIKNTNIFISGHKMDLVVLPKVE